MNRELKKRLIEVSFPLPEVSGESLRDPSIHRGHIRTLHIWWARRPLAASRATALAALLPDDPARREEYLQLVRDIAPWEVVSKDTPQNRALLDKARKLILEANGGKPPKVLDCFAGGGAIPLEALRLGCETYALDYNPVAVLLNKAVLEYPQKFGKPQTVKDTGNGSLGMTGERIINPLLEEVKKWGNWVLEEARKELEKFYPKDKDGSIPIGYLWARTVKCPNAECGAEIPLLRQSWLANKNDHKVALRITADKKHKRVSFEIQNGKRIDCEPEQGSVSGAHVRCPVCSGTIDDDRVREMFAEGGHGQRMVAVVLHHADRAGKIFRLPSSKDLDVLVEAKAALEVKRQRLYEQLGLEPVPDEVIPQERPSPNARGLSAITRYEMRKWGDLFNPRQQLILITFCDIVRRASRSLSAQGLPSDFVSAVATYLAFGVDKLASHLCVLTRWRPDALSFERPFDRPALKMVWDYGEVNPFSERRGCWNMERILDAIAHLSQGFPGAANVSQQSASALSWPDETFDAVLTDPPYYDNVPYSDLSDFFYVWLKRVVGNLFPDIFATPLTPKSEEIIWHQRHGGGYEAGKAFFEQRITKAFGEIHRVLKRDGIALVVYAHKTTEAWERMLRALLGAGLYVTASWPIHTEPKTRLNAQETASLASSVYMVCRKRDGNSVAEFPQIKSAIDRRVRAQLTEFWDAGIRGADFFMSAIGPAVEVFGRYERVEKLSGETVSVAELLDYVEKVVSEFALERILGSAELGGVDPETRFYLLWRWTYNSARVQFDEARKLATAVGTELTALWGPGQLVSKEKEFVRVLGPKDREKDKKFMNQVGFNTMVDALHRACIHWERGERRQLKEHLAQTYGANDTFWRVAQHIAEVLPKDDKEKQLLQGLLNVPEAKQRVPVGSGKLPFEG